MWEYQTVRFEHRTGFLAVRFDWEYFNTWINKLAKQGREVVSVVPEMDLERHIESYMIVFKRFTGDPGGAR